MHSLEIDGSYNTRASGTPGALWLIRSANLDAVTAAGEDSLRLLGLESVIDLRDAGETHDRRHTLPVVDLPIYDPAIGAPKTGSLEEIYTVLLRTRGEALTAAVSRIARAHGPVLVHCAAGKDRTGLVVALALLAAGVARADVIADYAASAASVRPARAAMTTALLAALELNEEDYAAAIRLHLDSPVAAIEHALALVDELGGVDAYLRDHGLSEQELAALRVRHTPMLASR